MFNRMELSLMNRRWDLDKKYLSLLYKEATGQISSHTHRTNFERNPNFSNFFKGLGEEMNEAARVGTKEWYNFKAKELSKEWRLKHYCRAVRFGEEDFRIMQAAGAGLGLIIPLLWMMKPSKPSKDPTKS